MKMIKLSTIALLFTVTPFTYSDDVEIYTGAGGSGSSNILFILDTSGSMSEWAVNNEGQTPNQPPPYNSSTVYPTDNYGFDTNAYYVFDSGEFSGRGDHLRTLSESEVNRIKQYEILPSSLNCSRSQVLSDIENQGVVTDEFAFFKPGEGWSGPDRNDEILRDGSPSVSTGGGTILQCKEYSGFGSRNYVYNGSSYKSISSSGYYDYSGAIYTNNDRYSWFLDATYDWGNWGDGSYNILWKGNYLNYMGTPYDDGIEASKMRLDLVRDAAKQVISSTSSANVNFSLMRFDSNSSGGFVGIPMTPITELRENFDDIVDKYHPAGGTPLSETLHEAYLYLTGDTMKYGEDSYSSTYKDIEKASRDPNTGFITGNSDANRLITTKTPSDPASVIGSTYKKPDFAGCTPKTKVILFSDGIPSNDEESNAAIRSLITNIGLAGDSYLSRSCSGDGGCAEELAYLMANQDHRPDTEGFQGITVDTMGGFLNAGSDAEDKLKDIATAGNGTYYPVDTYESIELGLRNSISGVVDDPSSFTSPTVAINSFNSLENSDEVYYAVFAPTETQKWKGNLKRYRLDKDGAIYDAEGYPALDRDSGFFSGSSRSFWSTDIDGATVDSGGAASRLEAGRNIYTISGNTLQKLSLTSTLLSDTLLGISGLTDLLTIRPKLISWILGFNEDGSVRKEIEDPLHSQPVIINYGPDDSTAFIATNSGYLHAFDTNEDNPKEHFAIIPKELLQNPNEYYSNSSFNAYDKVYGLDGRITYWHKDIDLNGLIDGNDKLYLYVGMRRGGHSYYAFDVTNRNAPQLKWQIDGSYIKTAGVNVPTAITPGFEELGQTWSALTPATIRWQGERKVVLFAGGGYDPAEDGSGIEGPLKRFENSAGRTIYMIDAETGELLWDARTQTQGLSSTEMKNGFATDVRPIDRDANGFADLLYATDVGGRVWRFDFNEYTITLDDFAKGGVIADINEPAKEDGNRRFFNSPDISLYTPTGVSNSQILVSIGSGYRAHPLSTLTTDYHFLIRDLSGTQTPSEYTAVGMSDLESWASGNASSVNGWYVPLQQNYEKVLADSVTSDGLVMFTTYAPQNLDDPDACEGDLGKARLYILDSKDPSGERLQKELAILLDDEDESGGTGGGGTSGGDFEFSNGTLWTSDLPSGISSKPLILVPGYGDGGNGDGDCQEGQEGCDEPLSCEDITGTTLIGPSDFENMLNRCDLINKTYWREE